MEHGSDYLMRLIWWSAHQWKRFKQGSIKVWVSMEWDDCRCRTIWVPVSQKDEKQLKSSTIQILRSRKDSGSRFLDDWRKEVIYLICCWKERFKTIASCISWRWDNVNLDENWCLAGPARSISAFWLLKCRKVDDPPTRSCVVSHAWRGYLLVN